ncbi:hypothetical protein K6119_09740 [Paracrocinitomix mangrovi]|uniref:hypothetical protein n=1 Tax=Paracrocinitomix mangrovi TaxID=2862509 RepID=UPI001C8DC92A|nr:hypothetical protein [Paracrocinitomix mangrovi]UKN03771.1 hypothetical protein K6119_09740 [Paracrocinitomix mangrovi]
MSSRIRLTTLIILFVAFSCSETPNTPEVVLENYITSINNCDCDRALEFSTDEMHGAVQNIIEKGCVPNEEDILSITCEESNDTAVCNLRVRRETEPFGKPFGKYTYNYTYSLLKKDGQWKVWVQWKSLNLPEEFFTDLSDSTDIISSEKSFEEFYDQFISDSIFQMSRIKFPLIGTYTDYGGNTEWTKEKWPLMTWDYREEIKTTDDSVSIIQTDSSFYFGTFCRDCGFSFWMEFEKLSGKWQLTSRQENNF